MLDVDVPCSVVSFTRYFFFGCHNLSHFFYNIGGGAYLSKDPKRCVIVVRLFADRVEIFTFNAFYLELSNEILFLNLELEFIYGTSLSQVELIGRYKLVVTQFIIYY